MNKLGIFMNFWENNWEADIAKYIDKASKIGFDVLEFQAQALLSMSEEKMQSLKTCAKEKGIELTYSLGLNPAYDISSDDISVREKGIKYLSEIMKRVAFMEGKIISGVSYAGWGIPKGDFCRERLFNNSVNSMKELMKSAEEYGIAYGVEAVNRFEGVILNTAEQAREYVEAVGSKNCGILLDTYHMNIEEDSIPDAIKTAGDLLIGFHTGENNRRAPGRAHLDWDGIFSALAQIGYKGRIVCEPFIMSGGEVGRDIALWRDLTQDKSESFLDSEAKYLLEFQKNLLLKYN